jgi:hypothetical protein
MLEPATAERYLVVLLRFGGLVCATALLAVVMPQAWHVAIHDWLGLGTFPDAPIAEYLARGMSGVCGVYGVLLIWMANDVRRYAGLLAAQAVLLMCVSLAATVMLIESGMPAWWLYGDAGSVWGFQLLVLLLLRRLKRSTTDQASVDSHATKSCLGRGSGNC